jgi:Tfp pilus assembly protein PilE
MKNFIAFLVAVILPLMVASSSNQLFIHQEAKPVKTLNAVMKSILSKKQSKLRTHHQVSPDSSTNLREQSLTASSSQVVRKSGWIETVAYDYTWYKNCKKPWFKDVAIVNTCGLSETGTDYGILSLQAYPDWNKYVLTQTYFSDSACTKPTGGYYTYSAPILICSYDELYHNIPAPLNPKTDNLNGFAYGIFTSQNSCLSGSAEGLLEAFYLKLNYCYQTDSNDVQFTSCSSSALTQTTYSTNDGTCGGSATTDVWSSSDVCTNSSFGALTSGWWFSGPSTFVCEM